MTKILRNRKGGGGTFWLLLFLINDLFVKLLAYCLTKLLSLILFVKNLSLKTCYVWSWYDTLTEYYPTIW